MFLILLCIYLEVELLVCTVMLLRTFQLFSKVAVPFTLQSGIFEGFSFPTFSSTFIITFFIMAILMGMIL